MSDDSRYHTERWRKVRKPVLARDAYRCWNPHCERYANVADHILPVYLGMPDAEFFGMHNLRASCRVDNIARGSMARLQRETEGVEPVRVRRTVFDSFSGREVQD